MIEQSRQCLWNYTVDFCTPDPILCSYSQFTLQLLVSYNHIQVKIATSYYGRQLATYWQLYSYRATRQFQFLHKKDTRRLEQTHYSLRAQPLPSILLQLANHKCNVCMYRTVDVQELYTVTHRQSYYHHQSVMQFINC